MIAILLTIALIACAIALALLVAERRANAVSAARWPTAGRTTMAPPPRRTTFDRKREQQGRVGR